MDSKQTRQKFIDFFISKGHTHIASSSLIPADDPTLLFANAGMNQFKDVFLGKEKRAYTRAVTSQKCVRAGGKHNDLDNVGFTKRHLTFFEMLGNFSFGDYFKKEAISYAWEFITKEIGLPKEHLYVSIYKDDDESFEIWNKQEGVPEHKIYRLGEKDNFWAMGDMGPCGPCTEIHIDRGPAWGCADIASCGPACDCDRFLEIWNLVFMQYDRQKDGSLKLLTQTGVDTGMGLERLCSVIQNKDSVFDTDLFAPIRQETERISGKTYTMQPDSIKAAFRVLEDHVRSSSMLIADGCQPSNEGRGYVLRKIIRRAALFARKITDRSLLPELSVIVVQEFGKVYPELIKNKELIAQTIAQEVEKFSENLVRGAELMSKYFQEYSGSKVIPGAAAFKLYDTYGFPIELIQLMSKENGFSIDMPGFDQEMAQQKERSGKPTLDALDYLQLPPSITSEFVGYDQMTTITSVVGLINENAHIIEELHAGHTGWIITQKSPFFVLGGGQAQDKGWVTFNNHKIDVLDMRLISHSVAIKIKADTTIKIGDAITVIVDQENRKSIMANHTATHLLQAALAEVFDKNIRQSGSLVTADYLRFDFTSGTSLTNEQLNKVEQLVNKKIQDNETVCIEYMTFDKAKQSGALAFFEEKYIPEKVRVVTVPGFSSELCCGTHVKATGDIGAFKITELRSISAGNRRIVAVTGSGAVTLFQNLFDMAKELALECKVASDKIVETVCGYKHEIKELATQLKHAKKELMTSTIPQLLNKVEVIHDIPFLHVFMDNCNNDDLKELAVKLDQKRPGLYFMTSMMDGRALFVAYLSPTLSNKIDLKKLVSWLKERHGMSGGGSQTLIQGGSAKIDPDLEKSIKEWVKTIGNV